MNFPIWTVLNEIHIKRMDNFFREACGVHAMCQLLHTTEPSSELIIVQLFKKNCPLVKSLFLA